MRYPVCAVFTLLSVTLPFGSRADGVYIPRVQLDPRSHARDITEPTQKAILVHFNGKERLILQVSYRGDVSEFAWLVPTPSQPEVSKPDWPVFHELHRATAPRIRYWLEADRLLQSGMMAGRGGAKSAAPPQVEVLERKQVGFYDIAVLRARDAQDLVTWLRTNQYAVTPKLSEVLADYIRRGWVFTAARIRTGAEKRVEGRLSEGVLQSVRLDFDSAEPVYPLKVSSLNHGRTEVLLYAISNHRLSAPGLATVCVLDTRSWEMHEAVTSVTYDLPDYRSVRSHLLYLSKLTANFAADQMTHDLVLERAGNDSLVERPTASPPFLDNLGAISLLLVTAPFVLPFSLITLFACAVVACSKWGARHGTAWWLGAAAAFVLPMPLMVWMQELSREGNYRPYGIVSLCGITVALALTVLAWRRARRKGTIDRPPT